MSWVKVICILCPRGCHLRVNPETYFVTGNQCPDGPEYAKKELQRPVRTVTATVTVNGGRFSRLPVKTEYPVNKDLIPDIMAALKNVVVSPPLNVGDVVVADIAGSGVNIVATRKLK
ncbi:MAG TPA: DUF1667 domain-containing protein [Clostridiaceae bacterium]|nr:DUF1667 domain-containing protein [Clostridiaceae bacterium]